MSPRFKWTLLGLGLAASAGLALFGDKTPEGALATVESVSGPGAEASARPGRPLGDDPRSAAPAPHWQARSASAAAAWLAQPVDLMRALNADATAVSSTNAPAAAEPPPSVVPIMLIGRSLAPGPRTVYLQATEPGSDVMLARVGSRVGEYLVVAISAEAVELHHRSSGQTISLPMGGPYGVFDVGARNATP